MAGAGQELPGIASAVTAGPAASSCGTGTALLAFILSNAPVQSHWEPAQVLGGNIWDHLKPFFENDAVAALGLGSCNLPHRCWKQRMWLCLPERMQSRQEGASPALHLLWTVGRSQPGFSSLLICPTFLKILFSKMDPAPILVLGLFGMWRWCCREQLLRVRLAQPYCSHTCNYTAGSFYNGAGDALAVGV